VYYYFNQNNAAFKICEVELDPEREVSTAEENMIFQSSYRETTQVKASKLHGHGYMSKYRTRRELRRENLEVHARAEAAAIERSLKFEAQVENLKLHLAQEAEEREREKEENRRKMQEELKSAKIALREEMKQELRNMLAQQKAGATNQVIFHIQISSFLLMKKLRL
jgi:hypothetical protein